MSVVMANALGTGIFCGLWQGIGSVLGLATWMGFVGCTSYFSAGCGKTGFIKSMCSNYVGLLWGYVYYHVRKYQQWHFVWCDRNWSFLLADLLSIKDRSIILSS